MRLSSNFSIPARAPLGFMRIQKNKLPYGGFFFIKNQSLPLHRILQSDARYPVHRISRPVLMATVRIRAFFILAR